MKKLVFSLFLSIVWASAANGQAFGVSRGDPVSRHSGRDAEVSGMSWIVTVPRPNPEFETYLAFATASTGICKISGLGKSYKNDKYGFDVKRSFGNLKILLKEKYGSSRDFDFLESGALWKDDDEFNWSIYKDERSIASFWDESEGSQMPEGVQSISLKINSVDPDSSYIVLTYEFDNFAECKKAQTQKSRSGL